MLGDRSQFPDLLADVYLNHAAIAPPSSRVRAACTRVLDDYAARGTGAWLAWREQRETLRARLARLIGAQPADIAHVPSTSRGIADIALCLPWRRGQRIVLLDGEFPANVTAWQQAARLFDLRTTFVPVAAFAGPSGAGLERLAAELRAGARLVAVSAVQFQTGLRMPLAEMAELCHAHGAELFVDAIQAAGVVPLDVRRLGVDYLVAGSHKWLMGIEGAGFVYVRPERVAALSPNVAGWLSHEDPASFLFEGEGRLRYDRPIRTRADFLEIGAMNAIGCAALDAAVETLLGLGIAAVYDHVQGIVDALEQGLVPLGFTSRRSPLAEQRSGILAVRPPEDVDLVALWRALGERGIACSTPDGMLRMAPHWPNDLQQVPRVLAAARDAIDAARGL